MLTACTALSSASAPKENKHRIVVVLRHDGSLVGNVCNAKSEPASEKLGAPAGGELMGGGGAFERPKPRLRAIEEPHRLELCRTHPVRMAWYLTICAHC